MYKNFYRFRKKPFNSNPDPGFLYFNDNYKEALALLQYGVEGQKGIVCLIGNAGTGKTMLLHKLLETIDENVTPIVLPYSQLRFEDLLDHIITTLQIDISPDNVTTRLNALKDYLIAESAKGHRVALIVDEAQKMDNTVLEHLRLLSNIETSQEKLLYIILLGQPELKEKLNLHDHYKFKQRISLGYTLKPLMATEVPLYIAHRLKVAGSVQGLKLFSDKALSLIAHYSQGIPRIINSLCDNALLMGYALERNKIDDSFIREAATDLILEDAPELIFQDDKSIETNIPFVPLPQKRSKASRTRLVITTFLFLTLMSIVLSQFKWPLMDYGTCVNDLISQIMSTNNQLNKEKPGSESVTYSEPGKSEILQKKTELLPTQLKEESAYPVTQETPFDEQPLVSGGEKTRVSSPVEDKDSELEEAEEITESKTLQHPEEPVKMPVHAATVRFIKPGDSIMKLAQEVYGTITDDILCLIHFTNPGIKNIDIVTRGQRIVFPPLNPEFMVFKQEDDRYRAFLAATKNLTQAATWQRELDDRKITSQIFPVNMTSSVRIYALISENHELKSHAVKIVKEASNLSFINHLREGGYE